MTGHVNDILESAPNVAALTTHEADILFVVKHGMDAHLADVEHTVPRVRALPCGYVDLNNIPHHHSTNVQLSSGFIVAPAWPRTLQFVWPEPLFAVHFTTLLCWQWNTLRDDWNESQLIHVFWDRWLVTHHQIFKTQKQVVFLVFREMEAIDITIVKDSQKYSPTSSSVQEGTDSSRDGLAGVLVLACLRQLFDGHVLVSLEFGALIFLHEDVLAKLVEVSFTSGRGVRAFLDSLPAVLHRNFDLARCPGVKERLALAVEFQ